MGSKIGAKHIGEAVGVDLNFRVGPRCFREFLADSAHGCGDQIARQCALARRCSWQCLLHEPLEQARAGCSCLLRLGRVAIQWGGIIERSSHSGLFAFGADKGVHERAQPGEWRLRGVTEDVGEHRVRLPPLVALQAKQDRRLVGKILVQGTDADARLLRDPGCGEALRALLRQNLNSSLQNG